MTHTLEVAQGGRFEFGKNWARFLSVLDATRIAEAEESLKNMLGTQSLAGMRFLDVGSGSGLFSLAARRLGASVRSFDYDPQSVACTGELKRRYFPSDVSWHVEEGSILNEAYVASLGVFDVVYSWGVLHHTGAMWRALDHARRPVAPGGRLLIAIYNDAGDRSVRWRRIKRFYNHLPTGFKLPFAWLVIGLGQARALGRAVLTLRFREYVRSWTRYSRNRGMSRWHDLVDWVGGYPYEVAKPEEIVEFYRAQGFSLAKMRSDQHPLGLNEFLFVRGMT